MTPKPHFALLRRPLAVWLAVLISLLGALAPALSHTLVWSHGGAPAWTEVCTTTGTRRVATSTPISTDSPDGQESAHSLVHCPFCLLSTDRAAPPPNTLLRLFVVPGEYEVPTIRQAFLFPTPFALTPPPRGPPNAITPVFVA